jgi:hypothetical protein
MDWAPPAVMMPLSALGFVLLVASLGWGLRPARVTVPAREQTGDVELSAQASPA